MITEIYNRSIDDPNFVYGVLEHKNPIESIISKIKMILGTRPGQVFGDVNFGVGVEDLIFETRINKMQLEQKIREQIHAYISEAADFKITPEVNFGKAQGYDYGIIDIYIDNQKVIGILIK